MNENLLEFEQPLWWIVPALLIAAGLSFLLYSKKNVPWGKNQNLLLGFLRFSALLLVLLLLLEPIIRHVVRTPERPLVVLALDNSASVAAVHSAEEQAAFLENLTLLANDLAEDKDYEVVLRPFVGQMDSLLFNAPVTDISAVIRSLENEYSGRNLAALALVTDGIFNRGVSPAYLPYTFPVYTLGLGDTIPQRDVSISDVRHNTVAFRGNSFPILANISQKGFAGSRVDVRLSENGQTLESRSITLNEADQEVQFLISSDAVGLRHYTVQVTEMSGEITFANNRYEVFIDILESKKQVRIAAASPHPDIRAIRQALESTGNYEVTVDIPALKKPEKMPANFDVQILFDGQAPVSGRSGIWRINTSQMGAHLKDAGFISVNVQGRPDQVIPAYNTGFSKFSLSTEPERMGNYSPLSVPFGEYTLTGPYEVLLYQQVGSVRTDKPLLAVLDDGSSRSAVSVAGGFWQWPLQEHARYGDDVLFAELVQKLVQYLSVTDQKKQFKVTRGRDVFTEGDVVHFDVEIFDDIYQPLEGQPYSIRITDEQDEVRTYEFVYGTESRTARTTRLPSGKYAYEARTTIGDKTLTERGELLVNALQLELRNLTADHQVLKQVSGKSDGRYFHLSEMEAFANTLRQSEFSGILHSHSERQPVNHLVWMLLLITALLTAEWVLRKIWGAF